MMNIMPHICIKVYAIYMDDLDKAVENLTTSASVDSDQIQPKIFLAQVYTKQKNQKDAIDTYEEALNIESDNENLRYDYAQSLVDFNLYSQAKHQYSELIALESESKLTYIIELAAIDLDHLENYEEALDIIKNATVDSSNFKTSEKEPPRQR